MSSPSFTRWGKQSSLVRPISANLTKPRQSDPRSSANVPKSAKPRLYGKAQAFRRSSSKGSKRRESTTSVSSTAGVDEPKPKLAWDIFSDFVKEVQQSGANEVPGAHKDSFSRMCSDLHNKVKGDIKAQDIKRQARNMMLKMKSVRTLLAADVPEPKEEVEEELDSEEEEEKEERERRRATARQHWGIIRRYVQQKIYKRKEKAKAGGKWNKLRAQTRATVSPEDVRRELFIKYGIVPRPGKRYPDDVSRQPGLTPKAKEIITHFEMIQVISLKNLKLHPLAIRPQTSSVGRLPITSIRTTSSAVR